MALTQEDVKTFPEKCERSNECRKLVLKDYPLHKAIYEDDYSTAIKVLHKGNVDRRDLVGVTPLMIAVASPCTENVEKFVKLLMSFEANPKKGSEIPVEHFYRCKHVQYAK